MLVTHWRPVKLPWQTVDGGADVTAAVLAVGRIFIDHSVTMLGVAADVVAAQ
jgi:hypothetical protein